MAHIDYFFTVISPYAYLAGNRLEEIAARHGATVTYKPVDIMALFARTGGTPLPQRAEARKAYRLQELRRQSVKTGLKLSL
ncbi:DsbA family protein, partial [Rhodovulum sulfidophilum]|uniref:DsbA family protein n=1 Tax=Rhodovulum sulfidophilum TaxID=35806 RepID=UPI001924DB14